MTDASTSTDDIYGPRELRVYYFQQPVGVVCESPPQEWSFHPPAAPCDVGPVVLHRRPLRLAPSSREMLSRRALPPLPPPAPPRPRALRAPKPLKPSLPPLSLPAPNRNIPHFLHDVINHIVTGQLKDIPSSRLRRRRRRPQARGPVLRLRAISSRLPIEPFTKRRTSSQCGKAPRFSGIEGPLADVQHHLLRMTHSAEFMKRDASPGLLRRRYSVPEAIMRRCHISRVDHNEHDDSDPEMRCACRCSRRELRRTTPKRQRFHLTDHSSDEMIRTAMKNSYGRSERDLLGRRRLDSPNCSRDRTIIRLSNESSPRSSVESNTDKSVTTSIVTAREIEGNDELVVSTENPYVSSLSQSGEDMLIESTESPYDVLEVVVSETIERSCESSTLDAHSPMQKVTNYSGRHSITNRLHRERDIDAYVSNILLESLNSLTDQLESINATMGGDLKLNVIEKEIKVKLQNTGVNTIVHLSPTSNNQIIFGNTELYNENDNKNISTKGDEIIKEDMHMDGKYDENNLTLSEKFETEYFKNNLNREYTVNISKNESANKAVLDQIQKLFKDELINEIESQPIQLHLTPKVPQVDLSNLNISIDSNGANEYENPNLSMKDEYLSSVSTGNYYEDVLTQNVVPRFTAFPYTESMEVNTSSSDDAEIVEQDCLSLVDSLDDPNSPRSIIARNLSSGQRSELVPSSIDILDLLPENVYEQQHSTHRTKEKGESYFVRITDENCDFDNEGIIVADHMPETIKNKLIRRHKKREYLKERSRQKKLKQYKRELPEKVNNFTQSNMMFDSDCKRILSGMVQELIYKIAEDELRFFSIKKKSKFHENQSNGSETNEEKTTPSYKNIKRRPKIQVKDIPYNSLELSSSSGDFGPENRIYQKSEIKKGGKNIEILEIIDCIDQPQHSIGYENMSNLDILSPSRRRSKIPVPVSEKLYKNTKTLDSIFYEKKEKNIDEVNQIESTSNLVANMWLNSFRGDNNNNTGTGNDFESFHDKRYGKNNNFVKEMRSRSNSLKFKQRFDIIPEEKSSLSFESPNEDVNMNHKLSTMQKSPLIIKRDILSRSNKVTMTSPSRKSAATSPINCKVNVDVQTTPTRLRRWFGLESPPKKPLLASGKENELIENNGMHKPLKDNAKALNIDDEGSQTTIQHKTNETQKNKILIAKNTGNQLKNKKKYPKTDIKEFSKIGKQNKKNLTLIKDKGTRTNHSKEPIRDTAESILEGSSSSNESGSSLLCSLKPKWLARKRDRKNTKNKGQCIQKDDAVGWSVTVAGGGGVKAPSMLDMRLHFPNTTQDHHRPQLHQVPGQCTGCAGVTFPPTNNDQLALAHPIMSSAGSRAIASVSEKTSVGNLPRLSQSHSRQRRFTRRTTTDTIKSRGKCCPQSWVPEGASLPIRMSCDSLCVRGCAVRVLPRKVHEVHPTRTSTSDLSSRNAHRH